jgi:hypothetical protein
MSIFACVLLVLAVFAYIFWPANSPEQREKTRLDFLEERKEVVYDNLRDLNFEHRAGKYAEDDYSAQRATLEDEAATILAEMDRLETAAPVARKVL